MTSRLLISLSVLLIASTKLSAQLAPAEDFFNGGAQLYISNNIPAALERVEMGLKTYPGDEKLKKLEQLLKQQQQQNQQNQQQQQSQNEQQKNSDAQKQQNQKDQPPKHNPSDQKKNQEQKPPEPKKDAGDQPKDERQDQQPGQPVKAGAMTPVEAKRLLDAQKGNEQLLQLKPENKPPHRERQVRDW